MAVDIEPTSAPVSRPFLELRPLLRALGIASDARKLILATAGLVVLHAGWWAATLAFGGSGLPSNPALAGPTFEGFSDLSKANPIESGLQVTEPFRSVVVHFAALFTKGMGLASWFQSALMATWAAAVWGIAGGAIARIAVVQAAVGSRVGLGTALRFAMGKSASLIGAPLTPMLAVAILAGCLAFFGLIDWIPAGIGAFLATVLGFVPLLLGLVMALILVGLALGWPLMHATIAAEGEDAPDALSRSYSYVNQRLVRYAVHAVAALGIGSVGLVAVVAFARVVLGLADWGVSLGSPGLDTLGETAKLGRLFWSRAVGFIVLAWAYSYFWSSASIIYLILRRDVDGTAWHDVYLPEYAADTFAGMPSPSVLEEAPKAVEAEV